MNEALATLAVLQMTVSTEKQWLFIQMVRIKRVIQIETTYLRAKCFAK